MKREKKKVVIVGAGVGGLTAAAYLCREDYDVLLLDKSDRTGGLVDTFQRDGFCFDTGPRAFVNSGMVKPILNDLGIDWEVVDNKISIAIEDQIFGVDSMDSMSQYKRMLHNLYPNESKDIEEIMKTIKKLSESTQILYEVDNPYFVDIFSDKKFLFQKFIPWTFKFIFALRKFKRFGMPMEDYLAGKTDNQSLIDILTQFFFRQTPTYFALGYYCVWLDYFYPKGGTGVLPRLLHEKVERDGGKFQLNTKIDRVIPSESKVVDSQGNQYKYDYLIWTADLKTLYNQVDDINLDSKTVNRINQQAIDVHTAKPAESSFIMHAGVERPPSYFKGIGSEHVFYTHSRRGLGDTSKGKKEELLKNFESKSKDEILKWLDDFCSLNTYEVSIPALRDSSLAPKGKTGIMISCLFDYEIIKKIDEAGWANEFKTEFEERIVKLFSKSFYPDFEKDILFKFSTTPLTINNMVGSSGGAIVGWSFETEAPVFNELNDMPKSAQTPIPNVFKAGQWAYAPAGVPIAMLTGWHATREIMKRSKK